MQNWLKTIDGISTCIAQPLTADFEGKDLSAHSGSGSWLCNAIVCRIDVKN
jgi:hypothetical protein